MGNGSGFMSKANTGYALVEEVAGVKIIRRTNKGKKESENTPPHSRTPNTMYARMDSHNKVVQIAVYENHDKIKDIEWGHNHGKYKKGEIHVQEYINGVRQEDPREPTEVERRIAERIRKEWNHE